jgi:glycosyltransferase involved in cell wall biosynthesis
MDANNRPNNRFKSDQPRVTIVTPSYNQGAYVERTILSVLRQDYPNIEYIFADAMSTDKTPEILSRYSNKISRIIREKDNGQSDALNKAFKLATGDILAYLNTDDCYASPRVISHAVQYLLADQDADVIYGKRYYIDLNGFLIIAHPYRPFDRSRLEKACYIGQECSFWTKDIYDRAGGFINADYRFAMDYELWFRLLAHGANFQAVNELYGLFRWHEDQKSNSMFEQVGLPEISRLQEQYLGKAIEKKQMFATFEEHFSGANRLSNPRSAGVYDMIWHLETHLKRMVLGLAPMDHWVYLNHKVEGNVAGIH